MNAPNRAGRTPKGGFDAEAESARSYYGLGGSWDGGGNTDDLRDGDSHFSSGDGNCGHRKKYGPAVRKVSHGGAHPEQLWEEISSTP